MENWKKYTFSNFPFVEKITKVINVKAQKRRFLKTFQYPTLSFRKPEQCERTKTDVFGSVFVMRLINVNAQKRMFFSSFFVQKRCNVNVA